jgi:hypothetical protein
VAFSDVMPLPVVLVLLRRRPVRPDCPGAVAPGWPPRLVVERFSASLKPDLFAPTGSPQFPGAHSLWGEKSPPWPLPLVT